MLRNNIAGTLSSIGLGAVQKANVVGEDKDLGQAIAKGINDWGDFGRKKALVDALESGDQEQINKTYAVYDPEAYAKQMFAKEQANQAREWQLADQETAFNRKKQLAAIKYANDIELENRRKGQSLNNIDGWTPTGNKKYDDAYAQEIGKKNAAKMLAENDAAEMKPALLQAMKRGYEAADSGNGIGIIGGTLAKFGISPGQNAGENFADVQSANTQMNTFLRKQLASTGLTGSELNSAVEAEAYRYQISPFDSEDVIKRKLQNFAADKLGGADFMNGNSKKPANIIEAIAAATSAGRKEQTGVERNWSKVSDDDLLKGL